MVTVTGTISAIMCRSGTNSDGESTWSVWFLREVWCRSPISSW